MAAGRLTVVMGFAVCAVVSVMAGAPLDNKGGSMRRKTVAAVCFIMSMMLLLGYMNVQTMRKQESFSEHIEGESPCELFGRVYDIREGSSGYQVSFYAEKVALPGAVYTGKTRVLLYMESVSGLEMGMRLYLSCEVKRPERASNPGTFDARSYYGGRGIYLTGRNVAIQGSWNHGNAVLQWLYEVRSRASDIIEGAFDEADASVVKAMLLGEKSTLDKDTKRLFQLNGIAHILAISGVHIAIIGMTLFKLLRRMTGSYTAAGAVAVMVVILYGVMTGLASSTFRAVIMMAVSVVGQMKGRSPDMLTSAGIALVIQALVDPYIIMDCGFELSFAAVAGMGIYGPLLKKIIPSKKSFVSTIIINVAVTCATTPIVAYYFYQLPMYSVLLNLVIVPLVSFILFISIGVICAGLLHAGAAALLAQPVSLILDFYRWSCRLVSELPCSNINVGHVTLPMVAVFYVSVYALLRLLGAAMSEAGRRRRYLAIALALFAAAGGAFYEMASLDRDSKVVFMDVGQGDCILIHSRSGVNILVDGGSSDISGVGEYIIAPVIKYYGAAHIDFAYVTHGDNDHIAGIRYLLETDNTGIVIENLVIPKYGIGDELGELAELAHENGINVMYMEAGQSVTANDESKATFICKEILGKIHDKLTLSFLQPGEKTDINDVNELSAVQMLDIGGISVLLTGDIGEEGEKALLAAGGDLSADVLKAGHHGSRYSSSSDFLAAVSPSLAVISAGENNSYGHPHEEALERLSAVGADILCTMDTGAVCVRAKDGVALIETYRN